MIKRTIQDEIEKAIKTKPVTLIIGARQVGKSTVALQFKEKGFSYVSLDNIHELEIALSDPKLFLSLHPWPLIIDEVQKAPKLFNVIEEIVNNEKIKNNENYGMYILTSSQMYRLMEGVSESLAGRVAIIHMLGLSYSEISSRSETFFSFDPIILNERAKLNPIEPIDLFRLIVKGSYPELYSNPKIDIDSFYSSYIQSYIERDVSSLINVKNKLAFRKFMELIASLTGQKSCMTISLK